MGLFKAIAFFSFGIVGYFEKLSILIMGAFYCCGDGEESYLMKSYGLISSSLLCSVFARNPSSVATLFPFGSFARYIVFKNFVSLMIKLASSKFPIKMAKKRFIRMM
jgi:hypothetical protein